MRYLQTKDIVHYLVESLRKVFATNNTWLNEDQEVVEITGANIPTVYDHQPREPEKYPIVVIEGTGGSVDYWGIDDFVDKIWISEKLGSVPRSYELLGNDCKQAIGIQVDDFLKLRDIAIAIGFKERLNGDINVNFSSASANVPGITISSGTINAFEDRDLLWKYIELNPPIVLAPNQLYYAELEAPDDCVYYIGKDTSPDLTLTPHPYHAVKYGSGSWNVSSSSTLLAIIQGPVYNRLGGGIQVNLSLRVEAKDIWTMHSIEDIIFMYLNMLKHSNLKRKQAIVYPPVLNVELQNLSELTEKGIHLINIVKGSEDVRERGNDRIFSVAFSIELYSLWQEDFEIITLKQITLDKQEFN